MALPAEIAESQSSDEPAIPGEPKNGLILGKKAS